MVRIINTAPAAAPRRVETPWQRGRVAPRVGKCTTIMQPPPLGYPEKFDLALRYGEKAIEVFGQHLPLAIGVVVGVIVCLFVLNRIRHRLR